MPRIKQYAVGASTRTGSFNAGYDPLISELFDSSVSIFPCTGWAFDINVGRCIGCLFRLQTVTLFSAYDHW